MRIADCFLIFSQNVETQFSFEDTFRSDLVDLLSLYQAVKEAGADRVGINDIMYAKPCAYITQ
jgi:isopropylmalate/homocitrate/citramalate synthase